jgi:hypothetical protein
MRGLTSTILLIGVLAGLGAYIYFVDSKRSGGTVGPAGTIVEPKDKVFTVEADKIEEVRVTADKESTLLKKVDGAWRIVEPTPVEADQTEASGLTTSLTGLEVNRVIEENASDLSRYGLAEPKFKVAFKGQNNVAGELHLGDRTATTTDMYAVKAGEKRVFLVPSYHENSFNKKPFDLRDKRILTVKRDDIDLLDVAGESTFQLARSGTEWSVKKPMQARGDYSAIEGLITRLSTANMTKMVEQGPAGGAFAADVLAKYGLDKPAATVTIGAGSARATLALGKEEEGAVYGRDLSRPMIFAVDPSLVTDLKKPADEYRNKNLLESRPFNLARLRIVRGGDTYEFQKIVGSGANQADKWQRSTNGGAAADVDAAKMDDFLAKLTNLRAESFVTAGASQSEIVVSASHDEGKFERVRFGKSGTDVLATRDGEPGAARVDANNYGEMVTALDAVIK